MSANNHAYPQQNYRIVIDLDAVMDWMTMLRGMTINGRFYQGFTSDELTRFSAFDGSDWEQTLPHRYTFREFLKQSIEGKAKNGDRLFNKVRPYDFAQASIEYLHRRDAEIIFRSTPLFDDYLDYLHQWVGETFPGEENTLTIDVIPSTTQISPADIWVVRNPDTIRLLKQDCQPHIVVDGPENARINDVVRVPRWDQVGFLLRHGQWIDYLSKTVPHEQIRFGHKVGPIPPPHKDIWQGNPYIVLPTDAAQKWLGSQRRSLELVQENPERRLKSIQQNHPDPEQQKSRTQVALRAVERDLEEVNRKLFNLREVVIDTHDKKAEHFDWAEIIRSREKEMAPVMMAICSELGIDPATGNTTNSYADKKAAKRNRERIRTESRTFGLIERILSGDPDEPIMLHLAASDVIHIFAENWDMIQNARFSREPTEVAGHLAEAAVALLLKRGNWRLLTTHVEKNGKGINSLRFLWRHPDVRKPHEKVIPINEYNRIDVSWHDLHSGELRTANVDLVTQGRRYDPKTGTSKPVIVIAEIKLSSLANLSPLQIELREHIKAGGRIINPGYPGVRTKTYKAQWREIRIDDGVMRTIRPGTPRSFFGRDATITEAPDIAHDAPSIRRGLSND